MDSFFSSDDGLAVWNFFDRYLAQKWSQAPQVYPVHKLFTPAEELAGAKNLA